MGGERDGEALVRADEVAAVVPRAAGGPGARHGAVGPLRGPRFLTDRRLLNGAALKAAVLAPRGARASTPSRVTTPDAIRDARDPPRRLARRRPPRRHGRGWRRPPSAAPIPAALWPEVRSVVMLGMNYAPRRRSARDAGRAQDRATISVYARKRDYHDVIKGKLKQLAAHARARRGGCEVKVFVDTAPVMEKPLAAAAGLGWQGKHTRARLARARIVALPRRDLHHGRAAARRGRAATIAARAGAASTSARRTRFPRPTSSMRAAASPISPSSTRGRSRASCAPGIGNRIFGCDDCLAVCPWNKFAQAARETKLAGAGRSRRAAAGRARPARRRRRSAQLFAGTPVKRTGRDRFVRNVLIAIGNSGDAALSRQTAGALLDDPSPLVRGAAVWALSRLLPSRPNSLPTRARVHAAGRRPDADVPRNGKLGRRET